MTNIKKIKLKEELERFDKAYIVMKRCLRDADKLIGNGNNGFNYFSGGEARVVITELFRERMKQ